MLAAAVGAGAGYYAGVSTLLAPSPVPQLTKTVTETVGSTVTVQSTVAANPFNTPKYNITCVAADLAGEFFIPIVRSAPDCNALFPVNFMLTGEASVDMKKMEDVMAAQIAKKPDGLIVFEVDATMQQLTQKAQAAGIPVIAFLIDDDLPHESGRLAYIGTDQYTAAFGTARRVVSKIPGKAGDTAVVFTHRPGAPDLEARAKGFSDVLTAAGFVVDKQLAGPEADKASEMAEAYMRAHSTIVAAFGCDGISSPSVGRAIDVLGLKDKVLGAGFDLVPRNLEYMQKGTLQAVANQQPYLILPVAVMAMYMHLASDKELAPYDANTGKGIIDQSNLAKFLKPTHWH